MNIKYILTLSPVDVIVWYFRYTITVCLNPFARQLQYSLLWVLLESWIEAELPIIGVLHGYVKMTNFPRITVNSLGGNEPCKDVVIRLGHKDIRFRHCSWGERPITGSSWSYRTLQSRCRSTRRCKVGAGQHDAAKSGSVNTTPLKPAINWMKIGISI